MMKQKARLHQSHTLLRYLQCQLGMNLNLVMEVVPGFQQGDAEDQVLVDITMGLLILGRVIASFKEFT